MTNRHSLKNPVTAMLRFGLMALCLFLCTARATAANEEPIPRAVQRLQHFLNSLKTLKADFIQKAAVSKEGIPTESYGHFTTARPNRFRWDYHKPVEQTLVSNGQTIWFYESDLEQVTLSDATRLEDTPALLFSSGEPLSALFTWKIAQDAVSKIPIVQLFPRKNGSIQQIDLILHPDREELMQLITHDSLGNISVFSFQNMHINQPVPEGRFQFIIPPNVDIIRDQS